MDAAETQTAMQAQEWEAVLAAAQAARAAGGRAQALAQFAQLANLLPEAGWARVEMGTELSALGRVDEAEQAYLAALALEPVNIHAKVGLAHCARARGQHEAALALFQAAAEAEPEADWPRLEVAAELQTLGRLAEAETVFQGVLAVAPGNVYAHLGLGHLARRRGDQEAALALFQAARAAAPDNPWPCIEIAASLRELGRAEAAEAAYRMAYGSGVDYLVELGLGQCARVSGARGVARAHFQTAVRLAPEQPWPWLELAAEHRNAGEFAAARQVVAEAMAHHAQAPQLWINLAQTEFQAGDFEAALVALAEARLLQPHDAGILVEIALTQRRLGRQAECDANLQQAYRLDPRNIAVISNLAEQALVAGDMAAARGYFARAVADQPEMIAFQIGALETQGAMGEVAAALDGFAALEEARGPTPELRMKWINLLREAGHYPRALELARDSTARFPHAFWLYIARLHVELLVGESTVIFDAVARIPAVTLAEQAIRRRFFGVLADINFRLEEAQRHYAAAARLNLEDSGPHYDLMRVKSLTLDLPGAREHLRRSRDIDAHFIRLRGLSLNLSQTHYGQILDEYMLDAALVRELHELQCLPPLQRAQASRPLVRANPDSTAAAVNLLVALRQSGRLTAWRPGRSGAIPQTITQFWDQDEPPADVLHLMESWRAHNPDYQQIRFSQTQAAEFLKAHFPEPVLHAFLRVREPAQKADIFRLAWLVLRGGVYADADDRCTAPLATIVPEGAELVLYQEDHGTLGNNFIAAAPGSKILGRALVLAANAINRGDSDIVWLSTGPGLISRAFANILVTQDELAPAPGVVILDRRDLYRAVGVHCVALYKKTDRHWSNSSFGVKKRAIET